MSPIAAYHREADSFLVMDVARKTFQPVWVPTETLCVLAPCVAMTFKRSSSPLSHLARILAQSLRYEIVRFHRHLWVSIDIWYVIIVPRHQVPRDAYNGRAPRRKLRRNVPR